jgi:hypothetical protein
LAIAHRPSLAKLETWRHDTASAFARGKREGVIVSDAGHVRLARALAAAGEIDAARVWDLARSGEGVVYAATGDAGKVYRREGDGPWTVAFDAEDTQAFSVVVTPGGRAFAGTGPSGQVVDLSDPKHPASRPDPSVRYIWDLAADAEGNLYAATGPTGQLWKRSATGAWSLLLDSKQPHLLCVALGPDGSVYAGSDGEGLIYRVAKDGRVSVLYDAPQSEVRTLLLAPDGTLLAGTAAESGGGGSGGGMIRAAEPPGGTAAPRPAAPGDNAVYAIGPDGAPREVFRARALIFALAWQEGRLLVGTGPEGQLFEVRDLGRESAPIARLDHGQILALLAEPRGGLLIGAGDPGAVLRLAPGHAKSGTLTSDVLDAKLVARFGALSWRADQPAGTSVAVQVRTGNVGQPDETWSPWSAPRTDPASARAQVPHGRFAQYRVRLATDDPGVTPELKAVSLHYQTVNLPPELTRITVPDLTEGDGATRQTRLTLRWDASDPNGDDLTYTLDLRKEGWPDWVELDHEPLTEKSYNWDTTSVPAGIYRVRVRASDRPSNAPDEALTRDLTSEPFVVDHQAPTVVVSAKGSKAAVTLKDDLTRLVKASYSLDGGEWIPVFPTDGLFDSTEEALTITLADLKPGTHVLVVRATDAAGNVGAGDAVFRVP